MGVGRWVWGAGLFTGACVVGAMVVRRPEAGAVDRELFDVVNDGHGVDADWAFVSITELGSMYAAGAAALTLTTLGRGDAAARAMSAAGATWVVLQGMKRLADRPRPLDANPDATRQLIARPVGMSWPSSHPAVLTTFSRVAARELGVGAMGRGVLSALDLSVAASRVYLGVHYPSDVASGVLIGRAIARVWPRGRTS
jgi:membrane-associated phospholipid phosphatase